jgi:hypothetical protein
MEARNVPHEMLGQYNSNREEKLRTHDSYSDGEQAKTLVLKVINGDIGSIRHRGSLCSSRNWPTSTRIAGRVR